MLGVYHRKIRTGSGSERLVRGDLGDEVVGWDWELWRDEMRECKQKNDYDFDIN